MTKDVLFAKQPIFDADNNLYGYEILYRNDEDSNKAVFSDGKLATSELLVNYCSGLIDDAIGPYVKIFINMTRELIFSSSFIPLPPDRIVIEILEDVEVDVDLLVRISELKENGYSFALDDYTFDARFDDLLTLVDYVKMDIVSLQADEIEERYSRLLEHTRQCEKMPTILAEKIETHAIHQACKNIGFLLFQGYFLARPEMVYGKKLVPSGQNALRLVAALQQEDITISAVCDLIVQDVQQSYLILKIVNSPICNLPRKIQSIQEGVIFLGLKQVKQWAIVMALTGCSSSPPELFRILLERAKTCELYAKELERNDFDKSYTAGLFSGLDLVMQSDKVWLLQQIGITQEMSDAILEFKGPIGKILEQVIELEKGSLERLDELKVQNIKALMNANLEATTWARDLFSMINQEK